MNFIGFKEEVRDFEELREILRDLCTGAKERPKPEDLEAVRIKIDPEDPTTKVIEYFVLEGTIPMWFPINLRSFKT